MAFCTDILCVREDLPLCWCWDSADSPGQELKPSWKDCSVFPSQDPCAFLHLLIRSEMQWGVTHPAASPALTAGSVRCSNWLSSCLKKYINSTFGKLTKHYGHVLLLFIPSHVWENSLRPRNFKHFIPRFDVLLTSRWGLRCLLVECRWTLLLVKCRMHLSGRLRHTNNSIVK